MVQIINSIEQKVIGRSSRHGYNKEECKKILDEKSIIGDVIVRRKKGFGQNSLRDFVGINYC